MRIAHVVDSMEVGGAETLVLQMLLEGVIDIMSGKTPHLIEMHLRGYQFEAAAGTAPAPKK